MMISYLHLLITRCHRKRGLTWIHMDGRKTSHWILLIACRKHCCRCTMLQSARFLLESLEHQIWPMRTDHRETCGTTSSWTDWNRQRLLNTFDVTLCDHTLFQKIKQTHRHKNMNSFARSDQLVKIQDNKEKQKWIKQLKHMHTCTRLCVNTSWKRVSLKMSHWE